jgi:hypothetical protein
MQHAEPPASVAERQAYVPEPRATSAVAERQASVAEPRAQRLNDKRQLLNHERRG